MVVRSDQIDEEKAEILVKSIAYLAIAAKIWKLSINTPDCFDINTFYLFQKLFLVYLGLIQHFLVQLTIAFGG